MKPRIHYHNVNYRPGKTKNIKEWLMEVIRHEGMLPGELHFIFVPDKIIRDINSEFLKHDYETDVITFGERDDKRVNGEIYIGIDTIKRNAKKYNVTIREELERVMVHGVLHIIGYDDQNMEARYEMREKENYYLNLRKSI